MSRTTAELVEANPSTSSGNEAHFPFTAIVGMDEMALALCLATISPAIGGVLVRGEKGTAKSTMVRALAAVLPPVEVVEHDRFSCDPGNPDPDCPDVARHGHGQVARPVRLVELPVGASEDRVTGSLHLDALLKSGQVAFEPGLLAQANRGVLYVDEVNLLPDHLVDTLLDSAAMGRARVEREGVSVTHAARFVLVGTMNPEEGELRPQLLDRFGLAVDVVASREPSVRVEVVRRRMRYEDDPASYMASHSEAEKALADRIAAAQARLGSVRLTDEALVQIAEICAAFDVDGMRGDLVTARTAVAHAAWEGRDEVTADDIRVAARLALPHRKRRNPFDDGDYNQLEDILEETVPETDEDSSDPVEDNDPSTGSGNDTPQDPSTSSGDEVQKPEPDTTTPEPVEGPQDADPKAEAPANSRGGSQGQAAGVPYKARLLSLPSTGAGVAGRRSSAEVTSGRQVRSVLPDDPRGQGFAPLATILAGVRRVASTPSTSSGAAVETCSETLGAVPAPSTGSGTGLDLQGSDLRKAVRRGKEGNLIVFVVDTSGSMGASARIREVKTACVSLLLDAYQRRDKVAVVTFHGKRAEVVVPPTGSVEVAEKQLSRVPTGGRTPLAEGLQTAYDLVLRERAKDPTRRALLVVLTDGRASSGGRAALPRAHRVADGVKAQGLASVVIDCEQSRAGFRLGLARDLAQHLDAEYLDLGELAAEHMSRAVRARTAG